MSEETKKPEVEPEEAEAPAEAPAQAAQAAVGRGRLVVLALIVLCLAWYLMANRYTPYTSQARVQGYVVGVAPKVSGLVTDVWVQNDQEVAEGQKLFQIDTSAYEIALARARSDLETASRQVEAGGAAVHAARAALDAARASEEKAAKDAARLRRLREEDPGTISLRRLELSVASLEVARAAVTAAEANIERAIEQMGGQDHEANAILKAALSAVEKAELDLANTTVTAASAGVVTDLRADVGRYAGAGSPVVTLISMRDVWVEAAFTENNLGHLGVGSPVEILFDVIPGRVFEGKVRSIGLGVGTGQAPPAGTLPVIQNDRDWLRQAQRFPVVVEFDVNQDENLYPQLRIGGQATVIGFTEGHGFLNSLGKLYIRLMSVFSYAY